MDDSYSPNILTVTDDDGTEDSEELLENDGELIIVKVREEGGETFLYPIEDDAEFAEIARVFEDRLQDLFEIDLEDEE